MNSRDCTQKLKKLTSLNAYISKQTILSDPGTFLVSDDQEKISILLSAYDIRNETTFCDVTFLVQGHLYRAHRIIVR